MVLARIEFKPEHASAFVESSGSTQNVIEQTFDSVDELIAVLREFEPFIKDCTAVVNGKMLQLSAFKAK
jgi:hypothetical protein